MTVQGNRLMKTHKSSRLAWLATALFTLAVGCGGSSSSGGGGGGGGSLGAGKVAVYATDSMDQNDHVWVVIKKVELNTANSSQTVFEDATGKSIDLKTLSDAGGNKFQLLSVGDVTGGPFRSATVTMGKTVTVFGPGATTGVDKLFDDQFDATGGVSKITFPFDQTRPFGSGDSEIVIDFDLANWDDTSGKIVPVLKESSGNGLGDDRRHVDDDYEGTIAGLTGTPPNQEFDLVTGGGRKFHVKTDSQTKVFNAGQLPNPTLANGKRVHVRGIFLVADGFLKAVSIKIQDSQGHHGQAELKGKVTAFDATAGTFVIEIAQACGFVPKQTTVDVTTTVSTVFRTDRGVFVTKDEFFAAMAVGKIVEAEGTYNPATNSLLALRCKFDDDLGGGGLDEAEGKGAVTDADAVAGTFSVTLSEWEGFAGQVGMKVNVVTTTNTVYKDKDRNVVDKATFFSQLATFGKAEVKGEFQGGTITAVLCKIED